MAKLQSVMIIAPAAVTPAQVKAIQATITNLASLDRSNTDRIDVEIHVAPDAAVLSPEDAAALAGVLTKSAELLKKVQSISTAPPPVA